LISHHFLNTKYIFDTELKIAIERQKKGECLILPVICSACGWEDVAILSKLHAIPRKGHNIASWKKNPDWKTRDDAWHSVYLEVKKALDDFLAVSIKKPTKL